MNKTWSSEFFPEGDYDRAVSKGNAPPEELVETSRKLFESRKGQQTVYILNDVRELLTLLPPEHSLQVASHAKANGVSHMVFSTITYDPGRATYGKLIDAVVAQTDVKLSLMYFPKEDEAIEWIRSLQAEA